MTLSNNRQEDSQVSCFKSGGRPRECDGEIVERQIKLLTYERLHKKSFSPDFTDSDIADANGGTNIDCDDKEEIYII